MLRVRRLIFLLAIVSSFLTTYSTPTFACSCVPPGPPAEELAKSTAVFAGQVTGIEEPLRGPVISSAAPVKVTLQVSEVWKGPSRRTLVVTTAREGASCGYTFTEGGGYLVYARGTEDALKVSLCSRTQPLPAAGEDLAALGEGEIPAATGSEPAQDADPPASVPPCGTGIGLIIVAAVLGLRAVKSR